MQTRGTFPELYAGRKKAKPGEKPAPKRSKKTGVPVAEDGAGWTSRQPRPVNAPKGLAGRRAGSRAKAAGC